MAVVIIFLLAVLFVAAVWGREAAQKLFGGGLKVAAVLLALAAVVIIALAINLQPPSQTSIQRSLDTASRSAYHVPLDRSSASSAANPAASSVGFSGDLGNPKIGIQPEPLRPENGAQYGLLPGYGLYVRAVAPNTTAHSVGIQAGDYISQVDGVWLTDVDSLNRHNLGKRPGDIIVLRVLRGGQQYLIRVPLGNP